MGFGREEIRSWSILMSGRVFSETLFHLSIHFPLSTIADWIPVYPDGSFKECCIYNDTGPGAIPQLCQEFVYDHSGEREIEKQGGCVKRNIRDQRKKKKKKRKKHSRKR